MNSNLRKGLAKNRLLHVMAAHSPLSARLVEEAGFDGIWASGFELSPSMPCRISLSFP